MIFPEGTINFESPEANITPRTSRDDFLSSPLFAISKPLNQNAPWSRYSFQPFTASGERFCGDICFCSGAIYSMSLCSIRPEFGNSWSEQSLEKEQARHLFHKLLLRQIFERPPDEVIPRGRSDQDADGVFRFPWGSVSATTDIKAGGCYIIIKYAS